MMNTTLHPEIDDAFVARQRDRLVRLREELIGAGDAAGFEEAQLQEAVVNEPRDEMDDGDRLAQQATDESILSRTNARVMAINRALQRIDQGKYGFSDASGALIERAHREAIQKTVQTMHKLRQAG